MGKSVKLLILLVTLVPLAVACGGGDRASSDGTLVFGAAADPVVLDGALISDGESLRVIEQMFEGLTALKPGTSEVVPGLARSWKASQDGLSWTFNLRRGVSFHDGEPFDAAAVCFNFDRWYNFPAPFQLDVISYYWQFGFGGGFAKPTEGVAGPDESLYKSCEAVEELTVKLNLNRPSPILPLLLTLPSLSIASPTALQEFGADEGIVDQDGNLVSSGTYGTKHPVGTGPFKFESWTRGDRLVLVRNNDYWGEAAKLDRIIFRPIPDSAARLQALQTGEIHGYSGVEPRDFEEITSDSDLQLLARPPLNVGYIGFNQAFPPLDKIEVRQALAHAFNREEVVDAFYGGLGVTATQFMPPEILGYAEDVTRYEYDPEKSKRLLQEAGLTLPVKIDFWYPTDVTRSYMPDPKRNFEAFAADLEEAGFTVEPHAAPWTPDYLETVAEGKAQVYLIGWIADFSDPDNFIGSLFQSAQKQWGTDKHPNQEIIDLLDEAEAEPDQATRAELYREINRKIMDWLPGVPYVYAESALGFQADVHGYVPSPVEVEPLANVTVGE
jgi:peptide/nickel transport system substrate-binding protein